MNFGGEYPLNSLELSKLTAIQSLNTLVASVDRKKFFDV